MIIEEGLMPGDRVVVTDLLPAIPGMKLRPTPDEAMAADIAARLAPEAAR